MSDFSELIKKFDKVRDYMRDFFIYGYKTRSDFEYKSLRTYDNERRRIESWLGNLVSFDHSKKGKQISISLDSGQLPINPLYKAYQSKSFTDFDILLHFYILDLLQDAKGLTLEELTDQIYETYEQYIEPQTIRLKLNEYVKEGILLKEKCGRAYTYRLMKELPSTIGAGINNFSDAITFFSQSAPFGVVGNYLAEQLDIKNERFLFKHNFIVHTLEDNILLTLIKAMEAKCSVKITNFGRKKQESSIIGIPFKVLESTQTGRRYIVNYSPQYHTYHTIRMDYIKSVTCFDFVEDYDKLYQNFEADSAYCWGVSYKTIGPKMRKEHLKMILTIDETKERYIVERLKREGRNGLVEHIGKNTYSYSIEIYDTNEMMSWVKTFIGRILRLEGSNTTVIQKFYTDIYRMEQMYRGID